MNNNHEDTADHLNDWDRFEELAALSSLFDLDDDDSAELSQLRQKCGVAEAEFVQDDYLKIAAMIDGGLSQIDPVPMPAGLRSRILSDFSSGTRSPSSVRKQDSAAGSSLAVSVKRAVQNASDADSSVADTNVADANVADAGVGGSSLSGKRSPVGMPFHIRESMAWILASACGLAALIGWTGRPPERQPLVAVAQSADDYAKQLYQTLDPLAGSQNVVRVGWKDAQGNELPGDLIWDKRKQVGVMRLVRLSVETDASEDYQLWIFDPERKKRGDKLERVGGPVFDLPNDDKETYIVVQSPLQLLDVGAFAITVEPKDGVVESKLEKIAAMSDSLNASVD